MRPLGNSWLRYSVPVNSGVFLVVPSLHPKKVLFSGCPRIDPAKICHAILPCYILGGREIGEGECIAEMSRLKIIQNVPIFRL